MSQSRRESLLEAGSNTLIGYAISVAVGRFLYPAFGYDVTIVDNMVITGLFVLGSLLRMYALRRFYESNAWQKIKRFFARIV